MFAALILCTTARAAVASPEKMVFFFFVSGKSSAGYPKEELQKMQDAHLANIRRLHAAGILKMAGPCEDPDKRRRGIILMNVATVKELDLHFKDDPFVREGIMKMEAFGVRVEEMRLGTPEEGISKHTIAVIEGSSDKDRSRFDPKYIRSLPEQERPAVVLGAGGPGRIRAVLFFPSDRADDVQKQLQELEPVKTGKFKATAFGQWMGKGMLAASRS